MKIIGLFLAIAVMIMLIGCSEKPVTTIPDESLELSAQAIPPDVQRLFDQYALDANSETGGGWSPSNGYNTDGNADANAQLDAYAVTFIWGNLENFAPESPNIPTVDWSGSMFVVADGMIRIVKPIDFEQWEGDSLLTETDPKAVAWVSRTSWDFDGVSFIILLRREAPSASATAITFATTPFTLSLTAGQMAWFAAYYQLSNVSGIAVLSQKLPPIYNCPSGLMIGRWVKADVTGDHGTFHGLWFNSNGDTTGIFTCLFWTGPNGIRLFSGGVSGVYTDQIIAYLEGTWHYEDPRMCPLCGAGFGRFSGFFRYPDHNQFDGFIDGQFGSLALPPDQLDLPLTGIWKAHCDRFAPSLQAVDQ